MSRFAARLRGIYAIEAEFSRKKIKNAQLHKGKKVRSTRLGEGIILAKEVTETPSRSRVLGDSFSRILNRCRTGDG